MKIKRFSIYLLMMVIGMFAGFAGHKAYAAVSTKTILPVLHEDVRDYDMVYIQVLSFDASEIYDTSANDSTGGMVGLSSATYNDTDVTVSVDDDFYIGSVPFPTNLKSNYYFIRQMGSHDAVPDKDDDVIGLPILVYWNKSDANITEYRGPRPVSF